MFTAVSGRLTNELTDSVADPDKEQLREREREREREEKTRRLTDSDEPLPAAP